MHEEDLPGAHCPAQRGNPRLQSSACGPATLWLPRPRGGQRAQILRSPPAALAGWGAVRADNRSLFHGS